MKCKIFFLFILLPSITLANLNLITWKGIYYQAIPVKKGITGEYCKAHTPGTFIHSIKDGFAVTDKGIKVTDSTFNMDKVDGVYLIYGEFVTSGTWNNKPWQDVIHYYVYKFAEAGITKGIWYSNECKGLYKGIAIKNQNKHLASFFDLVK